MMTQLRLKILAFGSPMMIQRLTDRVNKDEVRITGYSEASSTMMFLGKEQFDVIIVDNLVQEAEAVCQNAIVMAKAPVALLLRESAVDWKKLRSLEVDGYLPDGTGSAELMARIKAFSRRKILRPLILR